MLYLSLIVHIATINSFEVEVPRNICMNKDTDKSSIRHHKLAQNDYWS